MDHLPRGAIKEARGYNGQKHPELFHMTNFLCPANHVAGLGEGSSGVKS